MIATITTTAAPAVSPSAVRPHLGAVVRQHPSGGWTHALTAAGSSSARIYAGNWPTRRSALRALT
jgi:hypothetical protein